MISVLGTKISLALCTAMTCMAGGWLAEPTTFDELWNNWASNLRTKAEGIVQARKLTPQEANAVFEYTDETLPTNLNNWLIGQFDTASKTTEMYSEDSLRSYCTHLLGALEKLDDFGPETKREPVILVRGEGTNRLDRGGEIRLHMYFDAWLAESSFEVGNFYSTSIGVGLTSRPVLILIRVENDRHAGRNISELSVADDEDEILFPPGSQFEVTRFVSLGDATAEDIGSSDAANKAMASVKKAHIESILAEYGVTERFSGRDTMYWQYIVVMDAIKANNKIWDPKKIIKSITTK